MIVLSDMVLEQRKYLSRHSLRNWSSKNMTAQMQGERYEQSLTYAAPSKTEKLKDESDYSVASYLVMQ